MKTENAATPSEMDAKLPNGGTEAPSAAPEDAIEYPKSNVFDSQDFMNFLATQVDVANLLDATSISLMSSAIGST